MGIKLKKILKLTEISHLATVVLSWEDASAIKAEYDSKVVEGSEIQGFRKGKAPLNVCIGKIGRDKYYKDMREYVASKALEEALKGSDISPVVQPKFEFADWEYDGKGRKVRQTIWNSRTDSKPQYDISYQYDSRDQLLNEKYLRYNASTYQMEVVRERTYTYDNGGSLVKKTIKHENLWIEHTFQYSRGYHIVDWDWEIATGTGTPTSGTVAGVAYDANGNLTGHGAITITGSCSIFNLTSVTFTYDRKNRL
ncbi:MAG: trigger factor family protein, partial [bacterium]|nr:trigger factor family protein [bacterium]